MHPRSRVAAALAVVVLAGIGGAAWFLLSGGGEGGHATPTPAAAAPPEQTRRKPLEERMAESGAAEGVANAESGLVDPRASSRATLRVTVTGLVVAAGSRAPIPGATVSLVPAGGGAAIDAGTAADGSFSFSGVPTGLVVHVRASAAGHAPRILRGVVVPAGPRADLGAIVLVRGIPIAGRVVSDRGAPLAGAEVDLLVATAGSEAEVYDLVQLLRDLKQAPLPLDRALCAADGTFAFPAAAPGSHVLSARKPGWQVRTSNAVVVAENAAPPSVEIRLFAARVLRGVVRGDDGTPVAAAVVSALEVDATALHAPNTQKAVTAKDGRFAFDALGDGQVALVVEAPGHATASKGNLRAGGDEVEITLRRAARIEGRVFDRATGSGLAGAQVVALRLDEDLSFEETQSGEDGTYVFRAGPSGNGVTVFARFPGYILETVARASLAETPEDDVLDRSRAFAPGATVRVDLPMIQGGVVSGRVIDAATKEPVAGAEVVAMPRTGADFIAFADPVRARTGPDGSFRLAGLCAGRVQIDAHAEGFLTPAGASTPDPIDDPDPPVATDAPPPSVVVVPQGGAVSGVVVMLKRGFDVPVLVTDPDDRPLPGARVTWCSDADPPAALFGVRAPSRETVTDAAGRTRLRGVRPRVQVTIAAQHPDHPVGGHVALTLTEASPLPLVVRLVRGAGLSGHLVDADGAPAADRVVVLDIHEAAASKAFGSWSFSAHRATTGPRGEFRFENLPDGSATVRVHQADVDPNPVEGDAIVVEPENGVVTLSAGKMTEVTVRLGASITGFVRGETAGPNPVSVLVSTEAGASAGVVSTSPDGSFRVDGLRRGVYVITAVVEGEAGGPERRISVTASAGATGVEIRVPRR